MASVYNQNITLEENNKILVKQQRMLQKEIDKAAEHNKKLQLKTSKTNKDHPQPSTMNKTQKNLTINSVCSSIEGIDDLQNTLVAEVVDDVPNEPIMEEDKVAKKRELKNYKEKSFNVRVQVCDKMVIDKQVKYKIGVNKPKKTPKRNNAKNLDEELDEKDIVWEIDRDWSLTYFRRNTVLKKNKRLI